MVPVVLGVEGDDAGQIGDAENAQLLEGLQVSLRAGTTGGLGAGDGQGDSGGGPSTGEKVSTAAEVMDPSSHQAGRARIVLMTNMTKSRVFRITAHMVADGVAFLRRRIQEGSLMSTQLSESAQTRRAVSNILKGSAGNLVEWYDLYVYTVFAAYFQAHFFNSQDDLQAGLEAMAVFSTSFLMRPVGAWFFGRYADRKGRKAALTLSVTIMSAGSFAIAILPTTQQIGVWALVLLILVRLVQGFSVGGEYGTSATYMSEAATSKRRGFFSSFQYVTLIGGQMLALLVLVILQNTIDKGALTEWGWRIPFAIGGVAALVVLWLRRSMEETVSAEQVEAAKVPAVAGVAQPGTMKLLFTQHWKPLLICIGVTLGGTVAFYTYTNFILKFMNDTSGIAKTDTSVINFWALFIFMLLQPVYGIISDKVGRRPLLLWFGITGVLFTWPLLSTLAGTKDPFTAFLLMLGGLLIVGGYTSINALVKAELFPASIRALGVGLGYAIANSLFGGTVPLLGAAFQKAERVDLFFTYVTVAIAVSLLVYIFALKNKKATHLDHEQGRAWESAADASIAGSPDDDKDLVDASRR
ncbi:Sialic acid transporter NanT [Pseudarthrobacter sp. MM222]|nr:Sialic acid transporter NanT [Pseudarthrobacter sp. MM222]